MLYVFMCVCYSVVELTEDILRQLMDLVFQLVCNGELSLARVLRKNILDKVEQKRLLQHTHILQPLAARGVSARYKKKKKHTYIHTNVNLCSGCQRISVHSWAALIRNCWYLQNFLAKSVAS